MAVNAAKRPSADTLPPRAGDTEAQRQRLAARRLIESGRALMVSKTVVLELEWVMRGYHGFSPAEVASVLQHLLGMAPTVTVLS